MSIALDTNGNPCCAERLRRLEQLAHELLEDEERQELRDRVLRLRKRG